MNISVLLILILTGALVVARVEGRRTGERSACLVTGLYAWVLLAVPIGLVTAPALTILVILAALVLLVVAGLLRAAYIGVWSAIMGARASPESPALK